MDFKTLRVFHVFQLTRKLERIDCILYFPFVESHLSIDCLYLTQELDKLNLLDQYQYNYQISTLFPPQLSAELQILIFSNGVCWL